MSAAIVFGGNDASWRLAHEELVRLATERAGLDFEEGRALLRARRSGAHVRLGFASFLEYTERLFGYGARLTQDKLRIAEALEELPEIAGELQTGAINFSVAREVTRVAIPATEKEWLEAARGRTVRDVEQLVSGHRPGSLPTTFRTRGSSATCSAWSSRARSSRPSVKRWRKSVAMRASLSTNEADERAHGDVDGKADALAHVGEIPVRATQTIPPAMRRAVLRRDSGKCRVPGCRHAVFTEPHHLERRCEGGKHLIDNLVTLCGAHHRAAHSGSLIISRTPSSGLSFTHADGTPYGGAVAPAVADSRAKAFRALVGMGFREGEAKRALARLPHCVSSLEQVIRQALRELAPQ